MTPTSTYRLQLGREFGFRAAADVVPYLARLGVSHVYCSPVLAATPGSPHGYDVVDHSRLSPDLGGEAGWAALVAACREHGLGLVVDVVPNHMAVPVPESLNAALWDVLRLGRRSPYAEWFDIDWDAQDGQLLLPVLGRPLADAVAAGEVVVDVARGEVRYFDHRFPLAAGTERLEDQSYRLAYWRTGTAELNYRRFFDIASLVGVRVEVPAVFDATHATVLRLVTDGEVDGLRIDHPDGLADPAGYLDRLAAATGGAWTVVEKVLEPGETLPRAWACAGTTGYDALAAVTAVLTDPAGEQPLTDQHVDLADGTEPFAQVVESGKRFVVERVLPAEVERLVRDAQRAAATDPAAAGFTPDALRAAITELLVGFDVYRTYAGDTASARRIDAAARRAADRRPDRGAEIAWVACCLRRERDDDAASAFAVRFEQTTGPVTAKGVEDTAFYRYHRLVALNEVGGDPAVFGRPLADWHSFCARIAADWPATMTTLTTHDTKRSEDVRARLLVLAEIPREWGEAVRRWRARAACAAPDAGTDYLFWQTLVGAWPISVERMQRYLEKAVREAKQHTSWTDPDPDYEAAVRRFVDGVFADGSLLDDVDAFVASRLLDPAASNTLAQKLLALTMPGVPDVYQGQELTERSLVDPDNRRPVDYATRRRALDALDTGGDVEPKLRVTAAALRLRRTRPQTFAGGYRPLDVSGSAAAHAVAFAHAEDVVAVATRLPVRLRRAGGWGDTVLALPSGAWHDVLHDRPVRSSRLADLLAALPVALLARDGG